jgi:hypothetical protein
MSEPEELADVVSELLQVSKQINDAKDDLKVLTQVEKKMKEKLKSSMLSKDIDIINLKKGKIKLKKSVRKASFNKKSVTEGLTNYFKGDEKQVEEALNSINQILPEKETVTLSMLGIKDKKQ